MTSSSVTICDPMPDSSPQQTPATETPKATPAYMAIHDAAVIQGEISYIDPATGYLCFTALFHQNRGNCCLSNCRHCPFGFVP